MTLVPQPVPASVRVLELHLVPRGKPRQSLLGVGGFHLLGHKTGFAEDRGLAGYLPRLPCQSWSKWGLFWPIGEGVVRMSLE